MNVYKKAENVLTDIVGMSDSKEDYLIRVCEKRDAIVEKLKELKATKEAYDEAIKQTLKKPKKVTYGDWHISYIETVTNRIDTKLVKERYPEIAKECTSESLGTRLTISRIP